MTDCGHLEFNHKDPEFLKDPFGFYSQVRESCPVAHSDAYGGFWMLTRYTDVVEAALKPKTFSSAQGVFQPPMARRIRPFEMDPPEHSVLRRMLLPLMSEPAMAHLEPALREDARALVGAFAGRGSCDLVADFALPFVSSTLCRLLGVPLEDRERAIAWANAIIQERHVDPEGAEAAGAQLRDYLTQLQSSEDYRVGDHLPGRLLRPPPSSDVSSPSPTCRT